MCSHVFSIFFAFLAHFWSGSTYFAVAGGDFSLLQPLSGIQHEQRWLHSALRSSIRLCFVLGACGYRFLPRSNMYMIHLFAWIWICILYTFVRDGQSEFVCLFVCWLFSLYIVVFWHCVLKVWISSFLGNMHHGAPAFARANNCLTSEVYMHNMQCLSLLHMFATMFSNVLKLFDLCTCVYFHSELKAVSQILCTSCTVLLGCIMRATFSGKMLSWP